MQDNISSIYENVLLHSAANSELQEAIFAYGTKNKNYKLLSALVSYPGLTPKLEEQLGKLKNKRVTNAWALRPNRSIDEINSVLGKSPSQDLMVELLRSRTDLPTQTVEIILGKLNSLGILLHFATGRASHNQEIKESAFKRVLQLEPFYAEGRGQFPDEYRWDSYLTLAKEYSQFAEEIALTAKSPLLAAAGAIARRTSDESRVRVMELIGTRLDFQVTEYLALSDSDRRYRSWKEVRKLEWVGKVFTALALRSGLDGYTLTPVVKSLNSMILDEHTAPRERKELSELVELVLSCTKPEKVLAEELATAQAFEQVAAARSPEDLRTLFTNLKAGVSAGSSPINAIEDMLEIASSQYVDADLLYDIYQWLPSFNPNREIESHQVIARVKNMQTLANFYDKVGGLHDYYIGQAQDPKGLLVELINNHSGLYNYRTLLTSELVTEDVLMQIKLKYTLTEKLSNKVALALQGILINKLDTARQWEVLAESGPTFEGTLSEFLAQM